MVIFALLRFVRRVLRLKLLGGLLLLHYFSCWGVLWLTEKADSPIVEPVNFWYYWMTTTLTIGYGDLSPQSQAARLIVPIFEFTGIVLLSMGIAAGVEYFTTYSSRRRRGLMATTNRGHIVVLGDFHPTETMTLICNAAADWKDDGRRPRFACCFRNTGDRNPFERRAECSDIDLHYVQASESGFNRSSLSDANVTAAREIYISCTDDASTIGIIGMLSRIGTPARVVALLNQAESRDAIPMTGLNLDLILPIQTLLATREMGDPGTGAAIWELLSNGGQTIYSFLLRYDGVLEYERVRSILHRAHPELLLIGISVPCPEGHYAWTPHVNPDPKTNVVSGYQILYLANCDLGAEAESALMESLGAEAFV